MLSITTIELLSANNNIPSQNQNGIRSLPQLRSLPGRFYLFLCALDGGVVGQPGVGRGNCPADPAVVFPSCYQARVVEYTELSSLALQTMDVLRYQCPIYE